jgi:uncharacterized iron-regulated membrane protein
MIRNPKAIVMGVMAVILGILIVVGIALWGKKISHCEKSVQKERTASSAKGNAPPTAGYPKRWESLSGK